MKAANVAFALFLVPLAIWAGERPAQAEPPRPESVILIKNANVFDGKSEKLAEGVSVLVEGNKITKIAKSVTAPAGATVIDAEGRTLSSSTAMRHPCSAAWKSSSRHAIGQFEHIIKEIKS